MTILNDTFLVVRFTARGHKTYLLNKPNLVSYSWLPSRVSLLYSSEIPTPGYHTSCIPNILFGPPQFIPIQLLGVTTIFTNLAAKSHTIIWCTQMQIGVFHPVKAWTLRARRLEKKSRSRLQFLTNFTYKWEQIIFTRAILCIARSRFFSWSSTVSPSVSRRRVRTRTRASLISSIACQRTGRPGAPVRVFIID